MSLRLPCAIRSLHDHTLTWREFETDRPGRMTLPCHEPSLWIELAYRHICGDRPLLDGREVRAHKGWHPAAFLLFHEQRPQTREMVAEKRAEMTRRLTTESEGDR